MHQHYSAFVIDTAIAIVETVDGGVVLVARAVDNNQVASLSRPVVRGLICRKVGPADIGRSEVAFVGIVG